MTLESDLKELIVRELRLPGVAPAEIDDDAPLFGEGLGLDSLDAVELVVLLQKHYQIEITDMEQGRQVLASIRSLADHVRAARRGREVAGG